MMRNVLFQVHWFLGITAGLVLAFMGVTGATMSFEDEIMAALSRDVLSVPVPATPALTPDALIARALEQRPGVKVASLTVPSEPGKAGRVSFTPANGGKGRGETSYIDPYRGTLLGNLHGQAFFQTVRQLHRWLALPGNGNGIGRTITGIAAFSLIYFALSGLYLRWPRKPLDWRSWFVLDLRRTGRNLYRTLHAVIGGWVLVFYLISGFTGLWWSYDWYRTGVTYVLTGEHAKPEGGDRPGAPGGERQARAVPDGGERADHGAGGRRGNRADGGGRGNGANAGDRGNVGDQHDNNARADSAPSRDGDPGMASVNAAWAGLNRAHIDRFEEVTIMLPNGGGPVRMRGLLQGARHERMTDDIEVAGDGTVGKVDRYADRPLGKILIASILPVHQGSFFGLPGRIVMTLTSATMPLFAITGILLYLGRRKRKRALAALQPLADPAVTPADALLIAYASQTGRAQQLARQTAIAFEATGHPVRVLSLGDVGPQELAEAPRALFVASTYGDGEPPDEARAFARRIMASTLSLAHLEYAVLALGDDEYPDFCAFGRRLDGWLEASGGTRLFDCVEWNGEEDQARRRWAHAIGQLGANSHSADWLPAPYHRWQLAGRELINPGSPGAGAYRVVLAPAQGDALAWEPGDIVEVLPPDPRTGEPTDRPREYSIASLASSGKIELLVRQTVLDNGELGMASGWLTRHGAVGGIIELRLRPNPGFRPPAEPRPMVLIGNGTGLAGLLAHIRHRANNGRSWLLFGERTAAFDRFHGDELDRRLADGTLARADLIFSRDADGGYVQTLVERHAESLRAWIGDGAAIYVCGSLHGMAPAVDAALRAALGNETVDELIRTARYRRDVY